MPWVRLSAVFAVLSIALVSVRSITAPAETPTRPFLASPQKAHGPEGTLQAFVLELENRGGHIWHRVISDHLTNGETALAGRIRGATSKWTMTPAVGAKIGFAGGGGLPAIDDSFFLFDSDAQELAELAGAVAWDGTNVGAPITTCMPVLAAPPIDVRGQHFNRFAIRLRTFSDGSLGWNRLLARSGDRVRIRFFGYVR